MFYTSQEPLTKSSKRSRPSSKPSTCAAPHWGHGDALSSPRQGTGLTLWVPPSPLLVSPLLSHLGTKTQNHTVVQQEVTCQASSTELGGLPALALLLTFLLLLLLLLLCFHALGFLKVGDVFAPSFPFIFRVREFFVTGYSLIRIAD